MYIKKKLLAISVVLAMAASFAACSDKGSSSDGSSNSSAGNAAQNSIEAEDVTLSSEELDEITKHNLTIEPFVPEVQQDPVENNNDANNNAGGQTGNDNNNNSDGQTGNDNNNNSGGQTGNDNNNNSGAQAGNNNNNNSGGQAGGDNNNPGGQTGGDIGNNNVDLPSDTGLQVINGTPTIMQVYWMNLSEKSDYVFNGEYLVTQFKIKDNAADGIYPVTLNMLDFANWDSQTVNFTGIDGAIVVGGEAKENTFNDDGTPQVMVSNVSGKPGDTVTVTFHIKNNPGVVANILRFGYNSDALEYVGGGEGNDFNGHFQ